ncbi:MAG: hypothetical protein JO265_11640 [Acidimicrobiia bacterium]|nr:hypothetical protein [Acidimicrobiia bacterium]
MRADRVLTAAVSLVTATALGGCSLSTRLFERQAVRSTAAAPGVGVGVGATTSTTAPSPWLAAGDSATSFDDYRRRLSDPQGSDLPPLEAAAAADRGAALVRADLTGDGRGGFGDYWNQAAPSAAGGACCHDAVIEAAGAAFVSGRPDLVQVAVVWSAWRGAVVLSDRTTVVYFAATAHGLEPRHLDQLGP